jgi:tetratricopeptide (TPR) repeat protein
LLRGVAIFFITVALVAAGAELYLRSRDRAQWRRLEQAAERELLGGGLQGLLRARAMALAGATSVDHTESAATIALASAMLASEYGLDEANAARVAADRVDAARKASPRAQSLKLASRALAEVVAGRMDKAEALVRQSVSLGHKQASPLFVLGRLRFRQGNLAAASHALQAALVREPDFIEARVALGEVWLEQGEHERARESLVLALRHTRDHGRAQILLAELNAATGAGNAATATWEDACSRDGARSPFIAGACDLARAQRAARDHDWEGAIRWAKAAGQRRPAEPRLLGGAAQVLAAMGAVDYASSCLQDAIRTASPTLPSLYWAKVAVQLGRGQLADLTDRPRPVSSPWAPVLLSRNALASGGIKALSAILRELPSGSPGLDTVALLFSDDAPEKASAASTDPFHSYLVGVKARLAGKPAAAAALLGKALQGHGDACRAAGEYLAACRELGWSPDGAALSWLRRENAGCVNLPSAESVTNPAQAGQATRRPRHGSRSAYFGSAAGTSAPTGSALPPSTSTSPPPSPTPRSVQK